MVNFDSAGGEDGPLNYFSAKELFWNAVTSKRGMIADFNDNHILGGISKVQYIEVVISLTSNKPKPTRNV